MATLRRGAGVAFVVALALVACTTPTQSEAQASVCDAKAQFQEDLDAFRDLDPQTATIEDFRGAWVQARDSFAELRFYRQQLGEQNFEAAQQAVDDMASTVDNLPSDATVSDAVEAVQAQREELSSAVDNLVSEVDCDAE
jgi:hypothetical protein